MREAGAPSPRARRGASGSPRAPRRSGGALPRQPSCVVAATRRRPQPGRRARPRRPRVPRAGGRRPPPCPIRARPAVPLARRCAERLPAASGAPAPHSLPARHGRRSPRTRCAAPMARRRTRCASRAGEGARRWRRRGRSPPTLRTWILAPKLPVRTMDSGGAVRLGLGLLAYRRRCRGRRGFDRRRSSRMRALRTRSPRAARRDLCRDTRKAPRPAARGSPTARTRAPSGLPRFLFRRGAGLRNRRAVAGLRSRGFLGGSLRRSLRGARLLRRHRGPRLPALGCGARDSVLRGCALGTAGVSCRARVRRFGGRCCSVPRSTSPCRVSAIGRLAVSARDAAGRHRSRRSQPLAAPVPRRLRLPLPQVSEAALALRRRRRWRSCRRSRPLAARVPRSAQSVAPRRVHRRWQRRAAATLAGDRRAGSIDRLRTKRRAHRGERNGREKRRRHALVALARRRQRTWAAAPPACSPAEPRCRSPAPASTVTAVLARNAQPGSAARAASPA